MLIYKVLTADLYAALRILGEIPGSPADIADGFVHFSTADQLGATLARHFAGQDGLWLLAVESEAETIAPALEWEPARGGALFPHLYGALRLADIVRAEALRLGPDGVHVLPGPLP